MSRRKKNELVGASQVKAPELVGSKSDIPGHAREKELFDHKANLGLAYEVSGSTVYSRNARIPNAVKHFPTEPLLRTVDRLFPDPDGGLWIDEPKDERGVRECQRKAKIMKLEGCRYAYIGPEMELEDVLEQLKPEDNLGVA